mmetsp:Transcript_28485/g.88289  ORF Transcript_28485/g.88289 Transcript_28485/m.88289 type:complete len:225 (-) Transcript_28485:130-804(-)
MALVHESQHRHHSNERNEQEILDSVHEVHVERDGRRVLEVQAVRKPHRDVHSCVLPLKRHWDADRMLARAEVQTCEEQQLVADVNRNEVGAWHVSAKSCGSLVDDLKHQGECFATHMMRNPALGTDHDAEMTIARCQTVHSDDLRWPCLQRSERSFGLEHHHLACQRCNDEVDVAVADNVVRENGRVREVPDVVALDACRRATDDVHGTVVRCHDNVEPLRENL